MGVVSKLAFPVHHITFLIVTTDVHPLGRLHIASRSSLWWWYFSVPSTCYTCGASLSPIRRSWNRYGFMLSYPGVVVRYEYRHPEQISRPPTLCPYSDRCTNNNRWYELKACLSVRYRHVQGARESSVMSCNRMNIHWPMLVVGRDNYIRHPCGYPIRREAMAGPVENTGSNLASSSMSASAIAAVTSSSDSASWDSGRTVEIE